MAASFLRKLVSSSGTGLVNSLFGSVPPTEQRNGSHSWLVASLGVVSWHSDRNVEIFPLTGAKDRHLEKKNPTGEGRVLETNYV